MAIKIHQARDWDLSWHRRENKGEEKQQGSMGVRVVCKGFEILWISLGVCLEESPTSPALVTWH